MQKRHALLAIAVLALMTLACTSVRLFAETPGTQSAENPEGAQATSTPRPTSTPLPARPVQPGEANPDEPVAVTGEIPFTSRFFLLSFAEPFVLLEDQAGFVNRDREFEFPLDSQAIGAVDLIDDDTAEFSLALPAVPQGTYVDVDQDSGEDTGVQVFQVAYWSNTWGDPFLERRDGTGWSGSYTSALTDPENDAEYIGGTILVWAPDDEQEFPTGFGDDGLLFTEDDPIAPIPAGYNLVNMDQEPFEVWKEPRPELTLIEGAGALNDYSNMSYTEAFDALFEKVSVEYPFTEDKNIDWDALYNEVAPLVADADDDVEFYLAIREFVFAIPDSHVGSLFNQQVFFEEQGGSFGMLLAELSDGRVLVTEVLPGTAAAEAGIEVGAEILEWDGVPVSEALSAVEPKIFNSYSTEHGRRQAQLVFLTRVPVGTRVTVTYQNPDTSQPAEARMVAEQEVDSLVLALFPPGEELNLPVEAHMLETGLGYVEVKDFFDDTNLTARLWERYIQQMVENEVPGLIIDLRRNGGGSGSLATDFAGFFFDEEVLISQRSYYDNETGEFEYTPWPTRIIPANIQYEGPIAVLIGPDCVSACEGFAYALTVGNRATVVGNFPSAGAFGEVGQGQYELPGAISLQFPTGRPETPDGDLLIEGTGIVPDIVVPVTEEQVLGQSDPVLEAAEDTLLNP